MSDMAMLSNLKALVSPTPATPGTAPAPAIPAEGAPDFAHILDTATSVASGPVPAAPAAVPSVATAAPVAPDDTISTLVDDPAWVRPAAPAPAAPSIRADHDLPPPPTMQADATIASAEGEAVDSAPEPEQAERDSDGDNVTVVPATTQAPLPVPLAPPPVAMIAAPPLAVSLLQLVRDHMAGRVTPRQQEQSASVASTGDRTPDSDSAAAPVSQGDIAMPSPAPIASQPISTPQMAATGPVIDLSASLGAQMVDMGVSGQWLDGLARDIAGLTANGAQGRFQIMADHLGPVDVDIRQGVDGAAISLIVSNDAAETALRQDSDRLRLDASLSAVRISEIRIDRAPQANDAGGQDRSPQQSPQQQNGQQGQPSSAAQNPGQAMGQGAGQSAQQGRGQLAENIAAGHKAATDPAVINQEQAGDTAGDALRARYA